MIERDGYLLSAENALATVDQRDVEDRAMRLIKHPDVVKARNLAAHLWRNCAYSARAQMGGFDSMIDEYVFNYALWAANSDAANPKIAWVQKPACHWFGRDVPGSRWGGESPDALYRQIPIARDGRYELRVRPTCAEPPMSVYSLMANNAAQPITQALLDSPDLVKDQDGAFVITIDGSPPDGRRNHLQSKPDAGYLNIRDVLGDWMTQSPNALRIRRLDGAKSAAPSDAQLAERAALKLLDGLFFAYYCSQSGSTQAPNEMRAPVSAALTAGLANQLGTKANIDIADDEALIISANSAGARFRSAVIYDAFSLSIQYGSHTSSLNMAQTLADEDGAFTYVVAHEDPGVHNWLDTCGVNWLIFGHRWQSFPQEGAHEAPAISARVVKFKELDAALPRTARRIDAAGRRAQLAQREAGFKKRFVDH